MAFDYNSLESEFQEHTVELQSAYNNGDYYKAICYIKFLSNFYYQINYKFTDDFLEKVLEDISYKLLGENVLCNTRKDTIIFYDNFGLSERGLASIYVNSLIELGYNIIYILHDYAADKDIIIKRYSTYNNVTFEIIPKFIITNRMEYLSKLIVKYNPGHIFIYTTPDDVEGIGTISTIKGDVKRYLIDLTDHAFWLGKCAADYIIGFRNYGYNIALQYRNIESEKLLILPYYPEKRKYCSYEGMPFGEDKPFVFSGGSVYKIEGSAVYEKIVEHILDNYPEIYFVYAGNGESEKLDKLEEKYNGRLVHISERRDLDEVLQHAKVYLATYPESGGLMVQYALLNKCIPLDLCAQKGGITDPHTWLLNSDEIDFVFYSVDELCKEFDELMNNEEYYETKREGLDKFVISEAEFTEQLHSIIKNQQTVYVGVREEIDISQYLKLYRERISYDKYCEIIYRSRNKWIWDKYPDVIQRMENKQ